VEDVMQRPLRGRFITGLDLGQANGFTALAILERTDRSTNDNNRGPWQSHYDVVHLDRFPMGTSYAAIRDQLAQQFKEPLLRGSRLAIDHTGVGKAVLDLYENRRVTYHVYSVTVTAGASAVYHEGDWLVPKKDLVGELQVLLQGRRLHLSSQLEFADTLVKELQNFQIKLTPTANDAVTVWREGRNDDLVLAVAVAAWAGERYLDDDDGGLPYILEAPRNPFTWRGGLWQG
jgi:hypothetical protein